MRPIVANQARVFRQLLAKLRPHWRGDSALPRRIESLLRSDRRLGSRDRRLYRELIYTTLRYLPWIEPSLDSGADPVPAVAWLSAESQATEDFRAGAAPGWPPCPASVAGRAAQLGADAQSVLPAWLRAECPEAFEPEQLDTLCSRSPLWIRMQTDDPAEVWAEFAGLGWSFLTSPALPHAVRVSGAELSRLSSTRSYLAGQFEIQDIGSQSILESAGIEPSQSWLDACAGAGGKTLQLARLLGPQGRVDAHDIRKDSLEELRRRTKKGGPRPTGAGRAPIAIPQTLSPTYDGILVDAPCSGSGTWRRHPHLKWTTRPGDIASYARRQLALLSEFAPRVRPGGRIIYATCSLCRTENEDLAARFLETFPAFSSESNLRVWPSVFDGDGFYSASFRRNGEA